MNLVTVSPTALRPAPWRATHLLKPDQRLLHVSLREAGWLAPLVVRAADASLIDGHSRWGLAVEDRTIPQQVPVVYLDVDEIDAMIWHIRLNRARGMIYAKPFSRLIQTVVRSGKYDDADLEDVLSMSPDEVDLMLDGSLIKKRKVAQHTYSSAWVPVEAPPDAVTAPVIERPPTPDQ